jgi:protein-S-isoprenylcysteine O-methyltransferase Ste14
MEWMNLKWLSTLAFAGSVVSILWLAYHRALFGVGPLTLSIQAAAVLLMIWARITFGLRSFHLAANPTAGGLVTNGPYHYLRHPIYAAILYFVWTGIAAHCSLRNITVALLASALLAVRMLAEEKLLAGTYSEYAEYARRTRRVVPFLV